jgi:anti-sigma28 factor (negative regulator of flagellin synthesis)
MPTTKKRASAKKPGTKKATAAKATASLSGNKLNMNFPLTAAKIAAINRCIAKGSLKVTVNKVDLGRGRIGESWLYD